MREQEEIQCLNVFALKDGKRFRIAEYEDFSAYCESIKTEFGLCGLSLGAVIALNYVVEHPGKVTSLVLIGGQYVMPKGLLRLQNMIFRVMPNGIFKKMGLGKRTDSVDKIYDGAGFQRKIWKSGLQDTDRVWGEGPGKQKSHEMMAEKIPGANIKILEGCGHEVNVEARKNWLKALRRFTKKSRMGTLQKPWSMMINMQVMIDSGIPTSGSIKSQAESAMTGRR